MGVKENEEVYKKAKEKLATRKQFLEQNLWTKEDEIQYRKFVDEERIQYVGENANLKWRLATALRLIDDLIFDAGDDSFYNQRMSDVKFRKAHADAIRSGFPEAFGMKLGEKP